MPEGVQAIEQYRDMHAKFHNFTMYRYFEMIYVSIGFLEFYSE
jgi:hypothetical protein